MKNIFVYTFFLLFLIFPLFFSCSKKNLSGKRELPALEKADFAECVFRYKGQTSVFLCRFPSEKYMQVPLEDFCAFIALPYEVCGRCGNVALFLENGDRPLVEWNSPYVDFANKDGRLTLDTFTVYESGKTYVQKEIFYMLGIIEENELEAEKK